MLRYGHLVGIPTLLLPALSVASGWPSSFAAHASAGHAQRAAAAAGSAGALYVFTLIAVPLLVALASYRSPRSHPSPTNAAELSPDSQRQAATASATSPQPHHASHQTRRTAVPHLHVPHLHEHATQNIGQRLASQRNLAASIQTAAAAYWLTQLATFCTSVLRASDGPAWLLHLLYTSAARLSGPISSAPSLVQHGVADVSIGAVMAWVCKAAAGLGDCVLPVLVGGTCVATAAMWCCYWVGALAQASSG